MPAFKITKEEIEQLLIMAKRSIVEQINFPNLGEETTFEVQGTSRSDIFVVNIYRGRINKYKYNINARFTKNNIMLMELHIGPSNKHQNPDGQIITGDHWHIYNELHENHWAYPAENIQSDKFVDNTIVFLERFNVIKRPLIIEQIEF